MTLAHPHDVTSLAADICARQEQSQRRKRDALEIRDLHQIANDLRHGLKPDTLAVSVSREHALKIIDALESMT